MTLNFFLKTVLDSAANVKDKYRVTHDYKVKENMHKTSLQLVSRCLVFPIGHHLFYGMFCYRHYYLQ